MNRNNLLLKYDKDLRIHIMYPEARREITGDVVRFIRQTPGMNFISFTFATESKLTRVIDSEVSYFAPKNQPFTWKVFDHDPLPKLAEKLTAYGFVPDNDPSAVMIIDVRNVPEIIEPDKAVIRRITQHDGLKDVTQVLDNVYGGQNNWVYNRLGLHLQIPGYISIYAAYVDDEPASIAWTYFPPGNFATLFGGTTLTKYRNLGLYTALLQTRLKEIRECGYPFATVEAGPMSYPILEKQGFQHLTTVYEYQWKGK